MNWRIYKEGQGKWARNSVAATIALLSVFAVASFYKTLPDPTSVVEMNRTWLNSVLKVASWPFDYRFAITAPLLLALLGFGLWQYNRPRWADFLIDTENELKNRVTWPGRREVTTNSIVVVIVVLIIGAYTFIWDFALQWVQDRFYAWFY